MTWMQRIFMVAILTGSCYGCKKSPTDDCIPESFEYKFQNSMNIDTTRVLATDPNIDYYSYTIKAGNNTVFTYKHIFRDCPQIADDEGLKTIVFEIPQQSNSFLLNDSIQLRAAKCLISYSCFCYPTTPVLIKKGFIEGIKISANTWKIVASLQMPWSPQSTVSFDSFFTIQ